MKKTDVEICMPFHCFYPKENYEDCRLSHVVDINTLEIAKFVPIFYPRMNTETFYNMIAYGQKILNIEIIAEQPFIGYWCKH